MDTLLLDVTTWDLTLDISGNIAVATGPYAQAQDAASQLRLFEGELYYDTRQGVPYWQQILGKLPPVALMKAKFIQAALLVPGVMQANVFLNALSNRGVTGQVQITNNNGQVAAVSFTQ